MDIFTAKKGDKLKLVHSFPSTTCSVVEVSRRTEKNIWVYITNKSGKQIETRFFISGRFVSQYGVERDPQMLNTLSEGEESFLNTESEREQNLFYLANCKFAGLSNEELAGIVATLQKIKKTKKG